MPPERGKPERRKKGKQSTKARTVEMEVCEGAAKRERSRSTLCRKLIGADSSGFKVCLFMTRLLPC